MAGHDSEVLASEERAYVQYAAGSAEIFTRYGTGNTGIEPTDAKTYSIHAMADMRGYPLGEVIEEHRASTLASARAAIAGTLQTPLVMVDAGDTLNIAPAKSGGLEIT